ICFSVDGAGAPICLLSEPELKVFFRSSLTSRKCCGFIDAIRIASQLLSIFLTLSTLVKNTPEITRGLKQMKALLLLLCRRDRLHRRIAVIRTLHQLWKQEILPGQ